MLSTVENKQPLPLDSADTKIRPKRISQFSVKEALIGPMCKSNTQYRNVTFTNKDGSPVHLVLSGGGQIHKDFGVALSSYGNIDVRLSLNSADYENLQRLHDEMLECIIGNRTEYFPGNSHPDDFLKAMANNTVLPPKAKTAGDGEWPATLCAKIPKPEELTPNDNGVRVAKVKNLFDNTYIDNIYDIKGYKWSRLCIEFKSIYFQGGKGSFGFVKRLRFLGVTPPQDRLEVDSELDEDEHTDDNDKI